MGEHRIRQIGERQAADGSEEAPVQPRERGRLGEVMASPHTRAQGGEGR